MPWAGALKVYENRMKHKRTIEIILIPNPQRACNTIDMNIMITDISPAASPF